MTAILYSFRRCPYAMRARLAILASGVTVELREILLREKPAAFLAASPSATVPCLVLDRGVLDESLEVMLWALRQNDPGRWLEMPVAGWEWIARADGSFKQALDRVKYASRHSVEEVAAARDVAVAFFDDLEAAMGDWLLPRESLADNALLPFVRQFAFIDKPWFDAQPWSRTQRWLQRFLMSPQLAKAMEKENVWRDGDAPLLWPKLPADHHSSRPLPRSTAALQNKSP